MGISYADAASRVPVDLHNHLAWLITGTGDVRFYEDGKVDLPKGDEEKVLNLV